MHQECLHRLQTHVEKAVFTNTKTSVKLKKKTKFSKIFFTLTLSTIFFLIQKYRNTEILCNFDQNVYQKHEKNLKYILLWTPCDWAPFNFFGKGRENFIKNNCEFTNCFVTANKCFFGDVTRFDAIAFNNRNMRHTRQTELPQRRSPHQKYIFFNTESPSYAPVCNPWYENFYNLTSSYKLNSDIVDLYIYIRNKNGTPVGPSEDMNWVTDMEEINGELKEKLKSKKRAVAWFVSNCVTKSKREKYVASLQKALELYSHTVDIYGGCGPFKCPRASYENCNAMIASDYYFYLSFENSFAEDYVTEKLQRALNNDAVPIVYGGANYSRFLPPGSYIDARAHTPEALASIMADIIQTPSKYHDFFRWRNYYSYSGATNTEAACKMCETLNDEKKLNHSVYKQFRSWWNPNWKSQCTVWDFSSIFLKLKRLFSN